MLIASDIFLLLYKDKNKYKTGFSYAYFLFDNKRTKKLTIFLHFFYFCSIIEYTVLYVYVVRQ